MNVEDFCSSYLELRGQPICREEIGQLKSAIRQKKPRLSSQDFDWLSGALEHEERKWFVVFVIEEILGSVPKKLFSPMIRAAVCEKDPSFNRNFVEPCVKTFGRRKVNEALLEFLEKGTNREKAGAARALYWAQGTILRFPVNAPNFNIENATPESKAEYESLADLRQRKRNLYLREFVNNEDLNVRRSIIPSLDLDANVYSDELKPLVKEVIKIARLSEDDYIRHRVEVQLENENLFKPLPSLE